MRSSPLQTIIAIGICVFLLVYFFAPRIFSGGRTTFTYKKPDLPYEKEEIDPADCKSKNIKELMKGPMNQLDKRLIRVFKQYYLTSPSTEAYNFADDQEGGPDEGMSDIVIELLNQKRDGFFIESRVKLLDRSKAKFLSNSLHLEKEYGWQGVIVEPDQDIYTLLKTKNRKAWIVPAMLSPNVYPQLVGYFPQLEGLNPEEMAKMGGNMQITVVQSFPIITILASMKMRQVDYFSLSAQGRELEILGTIPFDKVIFKVVTIDHPHNQGTFQSIKSLMEGQGYIFVSSIIGEKYETSIYAHPSLFE